jgi:hypothetical protein
VKTLKTTLSIGTTLVILGFSVWLVFNFQSVVDWWKLRGYEPTAAIAQVSREASFSEEGQRLFYVHDPELLVKSDFQGKCTVGEETIVLGCYLSHSKIYLFDVTDMRLEGIEEVTAAHEMLHAVYDRLSPEEKELLDAQLLSFYDTITDERIKTTVENYRKRDPTIIPNELHSIIGTEVSEIPTELESHYSKYFVDRQKVVGLSEAYEAEFSQRQKQVEQYDVELQALSARITEQENQLALLGVALADEQAYLQTLRSNPSAYNNAVPSYNSKVNAYNDQLQVLKQDIEAYNQIVEARNIIATEEQDLVNSIDTRSLPVEQ